MKELGLLRHAKSDWSAEYEDDHDRPLAKRGVKAARLMGEFVSGVDLPPHVVYTSSALRARRTAKLAAEAGKWDCSVVIVAELYNAYVEDVLLFLRQLEDDWARIILVGHNPTWEDLLSSVVGGGNFRMPTAALAWVQLPIASWSRVGPGVGTLSWKITPKLLQRAGWKSVDSA